MRQLLGQQFRHLCGRGDRIPREKTQPRIECPTHAGFVALSKQNALFAVHAPSPDSPGPSSPRHSTAKSGQYNSHRPQPTHSAGAYSGFPSPSSESAPRTAERHAHPTAFAPLQIDEDFHTPTPWDALRHPAVANPVPLTAIPPGTAAALNRLESFRPQAAHSQPSAPAEHLSGNRLHPLGSPPPPYLVFLPMIHMSCILISRELRPALPHCGKSSKRNRSAPNRAAETPL